jgi:NAD(P)H dehydrogenase (quinone)
VKVLVVYYSLYGHTHRMAQAVAEGARSCSGVTVEIKRVPETLPQQVIEKMGATKSLAAQADVPVAEIDDLAEADAVVIGTPTRFGNMCGQMQQFLDAAGRLWQSGALVGKVGSVFTSSNTQHGGQESTILSVHSTLLHLGMVVVGLPYSFEGQTRMDEITGCSPYGASTIAGADGSRQPSENELAGARFQGRHVASLAARLAVAG